MIIPNEKNNVTSPVGPIVIAVMKNSIVNTNKTPKIAAYIYVSGFTAPAGPFTSAQTMTTVPRKKILFKK